MPIVLNPPNGIFYYMCSHCGAQYRYERTALICEADHGDVVREPEEASTVDFSE